MCVVLPDQKLMESCIYITAKANHEEKILYEKSFPASSSLLLLPQKKKKRKEILNIFPLSRFIVSFKHNFAISFQSSSESFYDFSPSFPWGTTRYDNLLFIENVLFFSSEIAFYLYLCLQRNFICKRKNILSSLLSIAKEINL